MSVSSPSPRRPSLRRPLLTLLAAAVALTAVTALALSASSPMEVDGNATDQVGGGNDWDTNNPVIKRDVVNSSTADDVYIQGGSKDERDISAAGITQNYWLHGFSSVPGKDDLVQAFAKEYLDGGKKLLYFGATRLVNDGDSAIGFWFTKNPISENAGTGTFSGKHAIGDILITSDFRKGGGTSVINVFVWNGNAASPLTLVQSSNAGLKPKDPVPQVFCDIGLASSANGVCAAANNAKVDIPGNMSDFVFGSGPNPVYPADGKFPVGTFFEGGIDLAALGLDSTACYSSVLAMTRSSASTDAQLKDFVLQKFGDCGLETTKVCKASSVDSSGEFITSTFDVQVKALGGTVSNVVFQEDITLSFGANDTTQPTGFPRCRRTDTGKWLASDTDSPVADSLAAGVTATIPLACDHTSEQLYNNVTASADDGNGGVSSSFTMEETCAPVFTTEIEVVKACDTVELQMIDGTVQPKVCNKITVSNKSSEGLTDIALYDQPDGGSVVQVTHDSLTNAAVPTALAVDGDFTVTHCYTPTTTNGAETDVTAATFLNEASVTGKGLLSKATVDDEGSKQCSLCPAPPADN